MARNTDSPRKFGQTYLREWREFRHLTQAQVVDRLTYMGGDLPSTTASLSRLENGKQPYSQPILEALANIYQTDAGSLLERNPHMAGEVIDFLAKLDEAQQKQVMAIAQAVVNSAS